jgi:hypothetical protein
MAPFLPSLWRAFGKEKMSNSPHPATAALDLRQRFILGLAKRLPEIETLIDSLGERQENLDLTMRAFHNLGGIGAMYGFPEVTLLARAAAERCAGLQEKSSEPQAGDVDYFRAIAVRLVEICSRAKWGSVVLGAVGPMSAPVSTR